MCTERCKFKPLQDSFFAVTRPEADDQSSDKLRYVRAALTAQWVQRLAVCTARFDFKPALPNLFLMSADLKPKAKALTNSMLLDITWPEAEGQTFDKLSLCSPDTFEGKNMSQESTGL